jgi:hypothetical protein
MKAHEDARKAHFGKNAQAMAYQMTDDMISVNGVRIHKPNRKRDVEVFQSYFNSVEFVKWDDVKPPEIRFSDDHSLAIWLIKWWVLHTKDSIGKPIEETAHYAWLSIYRKQNDGTWNLECIASTNRPEVTKLIE